MQAEFKKVFSAMGTRFELILRGEDFHHLEAVTAAIVDEVERLDSRLSRFNPGSEVTRINRTAGSRPVLVDRELFALLQRGSLASEMTHGYFDLAAATGGGDLALDEDGCSVRFLNPSAQLDLGGIGKGYALDRAAEILVRFSVGEALLSAGSSSILVRGGPWNVALRHPSLPGRTVKSLELSDEALSCSAARHPDQEISDVINPVTGQTVEGNEACAVWAGNATEAEILSTALLAMGKARAASFMEESCQKGLRVEWY